MLRLSFVTVLLGASLGCQLIPDIAHQPAVHNPFPQLSRVAVAPFFNHSDDETVDGRQFALAYYGELQEIPGFDVVPLSVVEEAMLAHRIGLNDPESARQLAEILDVDAVVIGAVTDFSPYYPPRCGLRVEWYTANRGFHAIPPGYGLPWGTPEEEYIPAPLVFEAEMALAREQLKTQTPICEHRICGPKVEPSGTRDLIYPGPAEDGPAEDGPAEDGPAEDGPAEDGPAEDGPAEDGPAEDGPAEDGPAEDGPAEDGPAEDRPSDGAEHADPAGAREDPFATDDAIQLAQVVQKEELASGSESLGGDLGPARNPAAMAPSLTQFQDDDEMPLGWPDERGFIPPGPCPVRPPCCPHHGPVMTHTQIYHGNDGKFTEALASYYHFRDDARFGGWQAYLQRSDDFIRFCCHLHISEMLTARGGGGETQVVWRWLESR